MLPKGCGKVATTIIGGQRQIKWFRTFNPTEDLGLMLCCCFKEGSILKAMHHKALVTSVGGWPGDLMNGREVGALGTVKMGGSSDAGLGWGVGSLFLFFFIQPRKAAKSRGKKNQAESDVKQNSWVMLALISKLNSGLRSKTLVWKPTGIRYCLSLSQGPSTCLTQQGPLSCLAQRLEAGF